MLAALFFALPAAHPAVRLLLALHIAAGTLALLLGLVPMLGRKGSATHMRAGRFYVACMSTVAVSALLLCALQPLQMGRLFLAGIALFSFYLTYTGWQAARHRVGALRPADRPLAAVALLVGLGMAGAGVYLHGILFGVFGGLISLNAGLDLRQSLRPAAVAQPWLVRHLVRMGGSYIAAVTALVVVNLGHWLPAGAPNWLGLAGWLLPGLVGRFLIARAVRRYRPAAQV